MDGPNMDALMLPVIEYKKCYKKLLHIKVINNEHNDFVKGYQGYQIGQQN